MTYINNYKEFTNLKNCKNDNMANASFNSVPHELNKLPKDFLFPKHDLKQKNLIALNSFMQNQLYEDAFSECFEPHVLTSRSPKKDLEVGDFIVKTQELKKEEKQETLKNAKSAKNLFEEKTEDIEKNVIDNPPQKKEQAPVKNKGFVLTSNQSTVKEEQKKQELTEKINFADEPKLKEEEKHTTELKKQELQAEKQNIVLHHDNKAAEKQVGDFLNAQKFAKEENKKLQEKEKAKKEAFESLEKIGEERKKIKRKRKGGQNNSLANEAEKEDKKTVKKLIHIATANPLFLIMLLILIIATLCVGIYLS
ncbi:MAG: hypothetical protein WCK67_06925 [bacterium]